MIFSVIVYFKIGLTITASQFFYFYLILMLTSENANGIGYLVSSLFDNEENATALAPTIILPFVVFGGLFSNSGNFQAWISWFQYVSPVRYGYEALIRNEFDSRSYNSTFNLQFPQFGRRIQFELILQSLTSNNTITILNALVNRKALLSNPSFNYSDWEITHMPEQSPTESLSFNVGLWKCLLLLAVIATAFRIASLVILKLLVRKFQ